MYDSDVEDELEEEGDSLKGILVAFSGWATPEIVHVGSDADEFEERSDYEDLGDFETSEEEEEEEEGEEKDSGKDEFDDFEVTTLYFVL